MGPRGHQAVLAISSPVTGHVGVFSPKADQHSLPPLPQQGWSQESHEDQCTRLQGQAPAWVSLSRTSAGVFTSRLTPEARFPVLG